MHQSSIELNAKRQIVQQKLIESFVPKLVNKHISTNNAVDKLVDNLRIMNVDINVKRQFSVEILLNIFRKVNNAKTILNLKLVDKRFNAIINEYADQFIKLNINNGITVRWEWHFRVFENEFFSLNLTNDYEGC